MLASSSLLIECFISLNYLFSNILTSSSHITRWIFITYKRMSLHSHNHSIFNYSQVASSQLTTSSHHVTISETKKKKKTYSNVAALIFTQSKLFRLYPIFCDDLDDHAIPCINVTLGCWSKHILHQGDTLVQWYWLNCVSLLVFPTNL